MTSITSAVTYVPIRDALAGIRNSACISPISPHQPALCLAQPICATPRHYEPSPCRCLAIRCVDCFSGIVRGVAGLARAFSETGPTAHSAGRFCCRGQPRWRRTLHRARDALTGRTHVQCAPGQGRSRTHCRPGMAGSGKAVQFHGLDTLRAATFLLATLPMRPRLSSAP
jgi:hypothetical protein